jgi:hypothetical protein
MEKETLTPQQKYYLKNKAKINEQKRQYLTNRYKTDENFREKMKMYNNNKYHTDEEYKLNSLNNRKALYRKRKIEKKTDETTFSISISI